MSLTLKNLLSYDDILLLQGKMGTFFCRFATFLMGQGKRVHKVNFNAGDALFYRHKDKMSNFRGRQSEFDDFLTKLINDKQLTAVVCFNDCRPYHEIARQVCGRLGVAFFVFEEGYLRPDYITLEEHGINAYSRLDLTLIDTVQKANDKPKFTGNRFYRMCGSTVNSISRTEKSLYICSSVV